MEEKTKPFISYNTYLSCIYIATETCLWREMHMHMSTANVNINMRDEEREIQTFYETAHKFYTHTGTPYSNMECKALLQVCSYHWKIQDPSKQLPFTKGVSTSEWWGMCVKYVSFIHGINACT